MAEVFEAELAGDLGFVRKVAIKRMLDGAAADPSAAQRFLDEARIASRLHHANVVSVVDLGLLDGLPFQVLELVEGLNAQQLMQRAGGKLPLEVALAIAGDVAHALDHAHGALDPAGLPLGIVHRDVKPSNVLVSWGGDVKLSDFGIAVARDRAASTEAGLVAGTMGFIAPEQRTRGQLDGRTDVFALGLMLHALVTGYTPLQDVEVEMRALLGDPIPLDGSLPEDVRAMIERAVAVTRTDRPSAAELAGTIGSILAPRLTGDVRSFLRGYLATLDRKPAKAGALDQLLGIEVVLTDSRESDRSVRHYATIALQRAEAPTIAKPTPVRADPPTVADRSELDEPVARPSRRAAPIFAAVVGLGLVAGAIVWQVRGDTEPRVRGPAITLAPADTGAGVPTDAGSELAITVDGSADAAPVASRPDARPARQPARPLDSGVHPAIASVPTGTGYLQVLGEDLVGSAVLVDGHVVGSVPNPIAAAFGIHRVEVERRDGTRLPVKTIEIKEVHTRTNPLRPAW